MKEIIVALATPFDSQGEIRFALLDQMIARNLQEGATGFFIGGSAGEGMLLTYDERVSLFRYLGKYAGKTRLFANVSALSVKEAGMLAEEAEDAGYDAVSSVIPYYYKHRMPSVAAYYLGVMESCKIPMLIYNFPGNSGMGFDLAHPDIIDLFRHPKVLGIKHTNRDLYEMERIMRINPNLKIYNGYDETFLNALPYNIAGAIGSTFNVTTPLFVKIAKAYEAGRMEEALRVQHDANAVMDVLIDVGLIAGIKYALECLGLPVGAPRLPFLELEEAEKSKVAETVDAFLR